jgi:8-oxo-dGTP pyrophosphatase MutT (NUDIX family)
MRRSEAAVALVRREQEEDGQTLWLAQWNPRWQAYNFVSGHREPEETFRECLIRELGEELGVRAEVDFTMSATPLAHLEYAAWSESARAETQYTMELFEVELIGDAWRTIEANSQNRWIGEAEIASGHCRNGQPVSPTMRRLLSSTGFPRSNDP